MEVNNLIKMGTLVEQWKESDVRTITFCVTEACNLACKYCYMIGKNTKNKLSIQTAKDAVDYFLNNQEEFNEKSVVWEFIGGEPFLEIDLIDEICNYIKYKMFELNHPWFDSYRFNFSTNGTLYLEENVQNFIKKNRTHLSIGMSVDGNKTKHDLQRVKLDGTGSYDDVMKAVPLWLKQFPGAGTKATFAHDDLPHLKDSIISLWKNGIKMVAANVVFEDVWCDGDDVIYENQLVELADYILENDMWKDYSVRFFDHRIGFPMDDYEKERNFCGAGNKMIAVGTDGRLFPCIRFYDMSLNNKKGLSIGDIYSGINKDLLRPFSVLSLRSQSLKECINCEVASGCHWCTGCNYDMADTETIYQRATYICKLHKANVRATEYFWNKFEKVTGLTSPRTIYRNSLYNKCLQFILSDSITPHCGYRNTRSNIEKMDKDIFDKGLLFAKNNGFKVVLLGNDTNLVSNNKDCFGIVSHDEDSSYENFINIYDNKIKDTKRKSDTSILLIDRSNINNLYILIKDILKVSMRVNVILQDIEYWSNVEKNIYESELDKLIPFIVDSYKKNFNVEVNVLTDILYTNFMSNCDAGETAFALAPNGKIYLCPAFYFDNPESFVGTLYTGINIKNKKLLELENSPLCNVCDAYHCRRCKFLNMKMTKNINIPSKLQCEISHIERNKSMKLQELLKANNLDDSSNILTKLNYIDVIDKLSR